MVQNFVDQFILTVNDWSDEKRQIAIEVVESIRQCLDINVYFAETKHENGQKIVFEGTSVGDELTKIIKTLKGI